MSINTYGLIGAALVVFLQATTTSKASAKPEVVNRSAAEQEQTAEPPTVDLGRDEWRKIHRSDVKRAAVWALDYMERNLNSVLAGREINMTGKALLGDLTRAAEKYYPHNSVMREWFIDEANDWVKAFAGDMKDSMESTVDLEAAIEEVKQTWREDRERFETSMEYNHVSPAEEARQKAKSDKAYKELMKSLGLPDEAEEK